MPNIVLLHVHVKFIQKGILWRYAIIFLTLNVHVDKYMLYMKYYSFVKDHGQNRVIMSNHEEAKNFWFYFPGFSLVLLGWEDIPNTHYSVSWNSQTPWIFWKIPGTLLCKTISNYFLIECNETMFCFWIHSITWKSICTKDMSMPSHGTYHK